MTVEQAAIDAAKRAYVESTSAEVADFEHALDRIFGRLRYEPFERELDTGYGRTVTLHGWREAW